MMGSDWHGAWMGLGGFWMVLFWVLIILGIIALVRFLSAGPDRNQPHTSDALRFLEERYARGEIGSEEFHRQKRDLGV